MTPAAVPPKETLLIEMLLCGLDLRANAAEAGSPMLVYLADLLVMRTREELDMITPSTGAETDDGDDPPA